MFTLYQLNSALTELLFHSIDSGFPCHLSHLLPAHFPDLVVYSMRTKQKQTTVICGIAGLVPVCMQTAGEHQQKPAQVNWG